MYYVHTQQDSRSHCTGEMRHETTVQSELLRLVHSTYVDHGSSFLIVADMYNLTICLILDCSRKTKFSKKEKNLFKCTPNCSTKVSFLVFMKFKNLFQGKPSKKVGRASTIFDLFNILFQNRTFLTKRERCVTLFFLLTFSRLFKEPNCFFLR
jgi:hypothetical protein